MLWFGLHSLVSRLWCRHSSKISWLFFLDYCFYLARMFKNIFKIFKDRISTTLFVILLLLAITIWYKYSAIDYVAANYQSYFYAYFDTFLSWCAIILFPLMISGIFYRSMNFGIQSWKQKVSWFFGFIGWVISVFITGASCCGITLISVLGLTSVIGFLEIFPYHGLELKILGVCLLSYSVYDLYAHIDECRLSKKNRWKS